MKLGIYQSYIKEPQKFFAPSNPCRFISNSTHPKPMRRKSCNDSPVYYILDPTPALIPPEPQNVKQKLVKKQPNFQMNKIELTLQDFASTSNPRPSQLKQDSQINKRPNTTKAFIGRLTFRPCTVNPKVQRKNSIY